PGPVPCLFEKLPPGSLERLLINSTAAFRDFPGITTERIAVLADQKHPPLPIEGNNAHREVLVVHDSIDPCLAVRARDLVFIDRDPRIVVDHFPRLALPGVGGRIRLRHGLRPGACGSVAEYSRTALLSIVAAAAGSPESAGGRTRRRPATPPGGRTTSP